MTEPQKKAISVSLSSFFTIILIFFWMTDRGFIGSSNNLVQNTKNDPKIEKTDNLITKKVSPLTSVKRVLGYGLDASKEVYTNIKDSVASVFVPFITGIEIYERK